jgi:hypothetical protein
MVPVIALSLAEQASVFSGADVASMAPNKTSAGVASGNIGEPSDMSSHRHSAAQSSVESNSGLPGIVTLHSSFAERVQPWPATDEKYSGGVAFAIWVALCGLSALGVIWLALTLIDAWSKV